MVRGQDSAWENVARKMLFSGLKERKVAQKQKEGRKEVALINSEHVTRAGFPNEGHFCSSLLREQKHVKEAEITELT